MALAGLGLFYTTDWHVGPHLASGRLVEILPDWTVPDEWNIRDAYLADPNGNKVADFKRHNLHVVGYSEPVDRELTLEELQPHLHSLAAQPAAISSGAPRVP